MNGNTHVHVHIKLTLMSVIKKDEIKREYVIGSQNNADVRHEKIFMDAKFHDNRKLN